ncbi:hypothetical protein L9F63_025455, partial [Diploptera punctata]
KSRSIPHITVEHCFALDPRQRQDTSPGGGQRDSQQRQDASPGDPSPVPQTITFTLDNPEKLMLKALVRAFRKGRFAEVKLQAVCASTVRALRDLKHKLQAGAPAVMALRLGRELYIDLKHTLQLERTLYVSDRPFSVVSSRQIRESERKLSETSSLSHHEESTVFPNTGRFWVGVMDDGIPRPSCRIIIIDTLVTDCVKKLLCL